ncbi:hypothetical protein MCP1_2850001 [Candidatus Terasakiella magnetica]|nr:hypothetical protein MCP1_2850001 [Candidatus Terasakiella magnetica]
MVIQSLKEPLRRQRRKLVLLTQVHIGTTTELVFGVSWDENVSALSLHLLENLIIRWPEIVPVGILVFLSMAENCIKEI